MLPTDLPTALAILVAVISLILAFIAALSANKCARYCAAAMEFVRKMEAKPVPKDTVAELSSEMTELVDSYHALLKSHKKLRARIGMREAREKRPEPQTEIDLASTTDKAALRLEAKSRGLLK